VLAPELARHLYVQPCPVSGASIYEQDWWLDAAAPGRWQRVEVHWDSMLVGSLSFATRRRLGLRYIELPPLTRTLSPHLRPPASSAAQRLMNRVKILETLLRKLPGHERFELALKTGCDTALPFVLLNYPVAHTYTYIVAPRTNPGQMHQKTRNVVTKAEREFEVVATFDPDRFLRLLRAQRAQELHTDLGAARRLYAAAQGRGQAAILCAVNQQDVDVASAILVWDSRCLYYWLSARDPARSSNGALSLLILRAMELAESLGLTFDTDGFGSKESGIFLAKFGLTPAVRPYVNHSGNVWKLLHLVSSLGRQRDDSHYRF
jgi:hypothetical protein